MATALTMEQHNRRKVLDVVTSIFGIALLCLIFVLTHASLHGSAYPTFTSGMALWAVSPLILVSLARSAPGFADANLRHFLALQILTLLALLLPQYSLDFRDVQFEFKGRMGVYAGFYPAFVAVVGSAITFLLAAVIPVKANWRVRILYSVVTGITVLSLFFFGD